MSYRQEQIDELKRYCTKLSMLNEGGISYLYLVELRLPAGCTPTVCDALLCPVAKDGYQSRLFFSMKIDGPFSRNWNVTDARIGEKNWCAFSWKVELPAPTLAQLLVSHLNGFAKEK